VSLNSFAYSCAYWRFRRHILKRTFGVKSFLAVVEQQVKNAPVWGLFWVAFAKCVVEFVLVAVK
jgi:hypothetical protein